MTSCGHIPASKIGHGGDAGELGNFIGVANLQGERVLALGLVPDGLPVTTDSADVLTTYARFLNDLQCRLGKGSRHHLIELPHAHQFACSGYG